MKVFISWSGPQSRDIASAFYNFLRDVIQHIKPFMSKHDIAAGTRWPERLARELATTGFGVICLTPKNQDAAWLMFEAGALSKALDQSLVFPYLYGLKPTDLKWPLAQFQASVVNEEGTKEIILSLNTAMGEHALPADVLERSFNRCWPDYEKALAAISEPEEAPKRDPAEVLEEILAAVRGPKQVATPNDMGMSEYEATHDFDCEFMGGPMERIKERADPSRLAAMATTFYHVTRLEPQTAHTLNQRIVA